MTAPFTSLACPRRHDSADPITKPRLPLRHVHPASGRSNVVCSQSHARALFAHAQDGEIPKSTVMEWAHATPDIKALPEHVSDKAQKRPQKHVKVASALLQGLQMGRDSGLPLSESLSRLNRRPQTLSQSLTSKLAASLLVKQASPLGSVVNTPTQGSGPLPSVSPGAKPQNPSALGKPLTTAMTGTSLKDPSRLDVQANSDKPQKSLMTLQNPKTQFQQGFVHQASVNPALTARDLLWAGLSMSPSLLKKAATPASSTAGPPPVVKPPRAAAGQGGGAPPQVSIKPTTALPSA